MSPEKVLERQEGGAGEPGESGGLGESLEGRRIQLKIVIVLSGLFLLKRFRDSFHLCQREGGGEPC